MSAIAEKPCVTPQEYLERENLAETRSEYDSGVITPMAPSSINHSRIVAAASVHLGNQLAKSGREVFAVNMRVCISGGAMYYYPDVVVVCGEARFEKTRFESDTLLNPTLIIEVLPDSTERRDRNEKRAAYETLDSLTDYVLISQTKPRIEHYSRLPDGGWRYLVARGMDAVLPLPTIACELPLAEVYRRVVFPVLTAPPETSE